MIILNSLHTCTNFLNIVIFVYVI